MGLGRFDRDERWRSEFAQEAARIMAEGGIEDYELAKRKARSRLNLPGSVSAPRNRDIERALIEYRELMGGGAHQDCVRELRRIAMEVMQAFSEFKPRLVGPVLTGSADESSAITLHLFAEAAEEVAFHLLDNGTRFRDFERRMHMGSGTIERVPGYMIMVHDVPVELLVFSGKARRRVPLSAVDGRPIQRASLRDVREMVEDVAKSHDPR